MSKPALKSGHVGEWEWRGRDQRLNLNLSTQGPAKTLNGEWSLAGLSAILEGLSKRGLMEAFEKTEGAVSCGLTLSTGQHLHLVGAYTEATEASGVILMDEKGSFARSEDLPGPDLHPVFQPIISLYNGRVAGFEALARWSDGASGLSRFDDAGLATNMLIRAAEALASMQRASKRDDLFVHVNVTARDLARGNVPELIEALMQGHNLPERALRIELTEQAALRDSGDAVEAALAIKAVGAGLVLDDFGTGHSSFAWLADLPADGVKIDPDLTRRLGEPRTDTILQTVTLLAERLGMTATAEGVENKADGARLRNLGFDYVQGFAYAHPMQEQDAINFLKMAS